jgi:hypothetical protein
VAAWIERNFCADPAFLKVGRGDRVDITISRGRLTQLLAGSLDRKMQPQAPTSAPDDLLGLTVPVGLKRIGREMRILVENADDQTPADPSWDYQESCV